MLPLFQLFGLVSVTLCLGPVLTRIESSNSRTSTSVDTGTAQQSKSGSVDSEVLSDTVVSDTSTENSNNEQDAVEDHHINIWLEGETYAADRPLLIDHRYTLNMMVGTAQAQSLVSGEGSVIPPPEHVPESGLMTQWRVTGTGVSFEPTDSPIKIQYRTLPGDNGVAMASFELRVPKHGDSEAPRLSLTPRRQWNVALDVSILVGGEVYRQFYIELSVADQAAPAIITAARPMLLRQEDYSAPLDHMDLQPPYKWTTPPGALLVTFSGDRVALDGDGGGGTVLAMEDQWAGTKARLAGPIDNLRASAERFRENWESYLEAIDAADLAEKLRRFQPFDWPPDDRALPILRDAWESVAKSGRTSGTRDSRLSRLRHVLSLGRRRKVLFGFARTRLSR
jgi:hypothetical protein